VAGSLVLAACGGDDTGDGGNGGDGDASISVTGTDALTFEPSQLSAEAGSVTIELTSEQAVEHTFVVEEASDAEVVAAAPGETSTGTIQLEPGTYTFYCDIPGHREAGMEGTLEVE
ncbi:MAG TPA: plastocyanin/azurin family copper-binding protein, partial [Actinomycetota bacterium]|nr:plastocyanin/azurin family copper-binding protein [Actinomycetota bacterium]